MDGNPLQRKGGIQMAAMLQVNRTLERLSLAGTDLHTDCVIAMATVLQGNSTLKSLDLSRPLLHSKMEEPTIHMSRMLQVWSIKMHAVLCYSHESYQECGQIALYKGDEQREWEREICCNVFFLALCVFPLHPYLPLLLVMQTALSLSLSLSLSSLTHSLPFLSLPFTFTLPGELHSLWTSPLKALNDRHRSWVAL